MAVTGLGTIKEADITITKEIDVYTANPNQMKAMGSQLNALQSELTMIRNDLALESKQRSELSTFFETYMKNYVDDLEGKMRSQQSDTRESIDLIARGVRSTDDKVNNIVEDLRRQQKMSADTFETERLERNTTIEKVRAMSVELGMALDAEKSTRSAALQNYGEELRAIRRSLDEDLAKTVNHNAEMVTTIEAKFRDMGIQLDSHSAGNLQKERAMEDKLTQWRTTVSADIALLRSDLDREVAERLKEMTMTVEALKSQAEQGDIKVQKGVMDAQDVMRREGQEVKRDTDMLLAEFKLTLERLSADNKSLSDRFNKQLDDHRRDVSATSVKAANDAADRLKAIVNEETSRLNQQMREMTAKQDAAKLSLDSDLQGIRQDTEAKLARARADLQGGFSGQRDLLTTLQDANVALKRELTDHKSQTQAAIEDALALEKRARAEAHAQVASGLEQTLRTELQRMESAGTAKHQDTRDLVSEADKRLQQALAEMRSGYDTRHSGAEDTMKRLQQSHELIQAALDSHKAESDGRLREADTKVLRAIAEMKSAMDGRHDKSEDNIRKLLSNHNEIRSDVVRSSSDLQDVHGKVTRAISDMKGGLESRHNATEDALKAQQQAIADLQASLATHKSDAVREVDMKLQKALTDSLKQSDGRHDSTEEILRKLLSAHTDLQGELKAHKGLQEASLRDADAKVLRAMSELKASQDGRHDRNEDMLRKFQQAQSELLGDLANHKTTVTRNMASERQMREEVLGKVQQSTTEVQTEMAKLKLELEGRMRDADSKIQQALGDVDGKLKQAVQQLTKEMSSRHDGHDDTFRRLQQVNKDLQAELAGHKGENDARLRDTDMKVQQAILALKSEHSGRFDGHDDALKKLMQAHSDIQKELAAHKSDNDVSRRKVVADMQADFASHKSDQDARLRDADAKVQLAIKALQADFSANHDGHADALKKLRQSHAELQAELAGHKSNSDALLQDADAKVQQAMADLRGEVVGRCDGHADAMKNLKQAHGELLEEMAKHKGDQNAKLLEADAKVQQAMRDLKADVGGRHEINSTTIQKLMQAHSDLQADLDKHKSDNDARMRDGDIKVQMAIREIQGRHDEHENAMNKMNQAQGDLRVDADKRVQQAMADLRGEMIGRGDGHEDAMKQLKQAHADLLAELAAHKGENNALLLEADGKVQQAMREIKLDMSGRHDGYNNTLQKLMQAHADLQQDLGQLKANHQDTIGKLTQAHKDLQGELAKHPGKFDGLLQDADARVQTAILEIKAEVAGKHSNHADTLEQLKAAHQELLTEIYNQKGENNAKLLDADRQVQEAMRELQEKSAVSARQISLEMSERHDGHEDALRRLAAANDELTKEVALLKDVGAAHSSNHEALTSTISIVERNMGTLGADLKSHVDRSLQDHGNNIQTEFEQRLVTLDERLLAMDEEIVRKIKDSMGAVIVSQEELQAKLDNQDHDQQIRRLWEAMDTHTHDVNVEEEMPTPQITKIIRPEPRRMSVVVAPEIIQAQPLSPALASPLQSQVFVPEYVTVPAPSRAVMPFNSQNVSQRTRSPPASASIGPSRMSPGTRSPRSITRASVGSTSRGASPSATPVGSVLISNPSVQDLASRRVNTGELIGQEKIRSQVDAHCGHAIFKHDN